MRHHLGADYSRPNQFVLQHRNEVLAEPHHPVVRAVLETGIHFAQAISQVGKSAVSDLVSHRQK